MDGFIRRSRTDRELKTVQSIRHPLIRQIFALMFLSPEKRSYIARKSGVSLSAIGNFRFVNPGLLSVEAVLNTLGYKLKIVRINAPDDDEPLCS